MTDAPKSAIELMMERLKQKDAEAGVTETPLTDAQRAAIAEARSVYEAKAAERRIMHQSMQATMMDPAEREARDQELRRDLERFESERDSRIRKIRAGESASPSSTD
ncbi:MAG: hypothetical protein LC753_14705 [Acidobacteria bacterium]|nr:hypothetical protein [Acidobacteriota bacterium]